MKPRTAEAQDKAVLEVTPVTYKQSQTVVVAGDVVTEAQLAVLRELGVVGGQEADYTLYITMFIYIALLFLRFTAGMWSSSRGRWARTRESCLCSPRSPWLRPRYPFRSHGWIRASSPRFLR